MIKKILLAAALALLALPVAAQTPQGEPGTGWKNMLVCGDASTCPWQRGTSISGITSSGTMTADYWEAIGGGSSSITISKAAQTGVNGFTSALQFQRASANTDTATLHFGQVLDSNDFGTSVQGKIVCLSFDVLSGANFSSANNAFTYKLFTGTGSNQGYATMVNATPWTGSATPINGTATLNSLAQHVSSCTQISSITTEVGIDFSWTPGGTAGTADYAQLLRVQLEVVTGLPLAQANGTSFDNRSITNELFLAQQRAYVISEPAASVSIAPSGQGASTTTCIMSIPFPRSMRAAPTFSAGGTALATTTWTVTHVVTNTALATPFLAAVTGGHTVNNGNLTATVASGLTAGATCTLTGAGGGSKLVFSADLT